MSEFQSYSWVTLHRRLTAEEQRAVDKLSSHIEVTSHSAEVTYEWGDFKHDPLQVLARYFDAFMYYSNWGTRILALRFPRQAVDAARWAPYLWDEAADLLEVGEWSILRFAVELDGREDWYDFDAALGTLAPLRDELLRGDERVLYLAWLMGISAAGVDDEYDLDDELSPPLPAGLGALTPALEAFAEFFAIDPYLVDAAAAVGGELHLPDATALQGQIARLTRAECDEFLLRLAQGDPQLHLDFQLRLREVAEPAPAASDGPARQRWGDLRQAAEQLAQTALAAQKAAAKAQRLQALQTLAAHEPETWCTVERLVDEQKASSYTQAVTLLRQLRELAVYENRLPAFQARVEAIAARQGKRTALVSRMREAGLM